jgi:protein-tyrosine-phosphatase
MILPNSVLFACTLNAIRSPMAEALLKQAHGDHMYVDSAGVDEAPIDPMMIEVMSEVGIDLRRHKTKTFEDLADSSFDLIVTLSAEAHQKAKEMTRTTACEVEFWPVSDPAYFEGSRLSLLDSYRSLRNELARRIRDRFPPKKP